MFVARDCLDSAETFVVERQQLVVRNLRLFQLAKYIVIVGRLHPTLLRDLRCDRLHLVARGREDKQCAVDKLMRLHAHAIVLQVVRVDLGRQAIGFASSRYHSGANPFGVVVELLREGLEVVLPTLEPSLLKELLYALEVLLLVLQMLLNLDIPGAGQRVVAQALVNASANERRNWLIPVLCSNVPLQTSDCRAMA